MKVYCFGNEFVKEDSLAKELADELRLPGIEFVRCLGPDELPLEEESITILDVAKGIKKVTILDDLDKLKTDRTCMSCHDMDLAFHLKLLKKTGTLKKIRIIAIPADGDKGLIKGQVTEELKRVLAETQP